MSELSERALPDDLEEDPLFWCARARAYLKGILPDSPSEEPLHLRKEDEPVLKDLKNGLAVLYLVDGGGMFYYIHNRHLRATGWSIDQLHSRSVENLASFAGPKLRLQDVGGAFMVLVDGNFEASLLLVDKFWDRIAVPRVGPDIAAALPARDVLTFCGADSAEGIARMRQGIAAVSSGGNHLLTDRLYRRVAGNWVPFEP